MHYSNCFWLFLVNVRERNRPWMTGLGSYDHERNSLSYKTVLLYLILFMSYKLSATLAAHSADVSYTLTRIRSQFSHGLG